MKETRYLELLKDNKLEDLKELLENNIRENIAIKSNSRTRIAAIKRILKNNEIRPNLLGFGLYNNQFAFTDSYILAVLNDNLGYEKNENFPNVSCIIERENKFKEKLYVSVEDLEYYVKIKEDYKNEYFNTENRKMLFDYKLIKNAIDIIGKECEIFTNDYRNMLIFTNKENEIVIIMGKVVI